MLTTTVKLFFGRMNCYFIVINKMANLNNVVLSYNKYFVPTPNIKYQIEELKEIKSSKSSKISKSNHVLDADLAQDVFHFHPC
jgi:hypothetical protein